MKESGKNVKALIQELGLDEPGRAERYEECETIAKLAPQEVVKLIKDPEIKECVNWIKAAHKNVQDNIKWVETYAQTIQFLFEKAGAKNVKRWHELEQLCEEIPEEDLKNMDEKSKKLVGLVQHIHDTSSERRVKIIEMINDEIR